MRTIPKTAKKYFIGTCHPLKIEQLIKSIQLCYISQVKIKKTECRVEADAIIKNRGRVCRDRRMGRVKYDE